MASSYRPLALYLAAVLGFAALYVGIAELSLFFAGNVGKVSPIWPLSGVVLVALLRFGLRFWPGIALGDFIVALLLNFPLPLALGVATASTVEVLLAAFWLQRLLHGLPSPHRVYDMGLLVLLAGFAAPAVGASLASSAYLATGQAPLAALPGIWVTWSSGNSLGTLVVAPLLLAWLRHPLPRLTQVQWLEAAVLLTVTLVLCLFSFTVSPDYSYLLMPGLIWAAFRFGSRGTTMLTLLLTAVAVYFTSSGFGPFARGSVQENLIYLNTFTAVVSVLGLLLAATVAERQQAQHMQAETLAQLDSLLTQLPIGFAFVDQQGHYRRVNQVFANLYDQPSSKLLDQPMHSSQHNHNLHLALWVQQTHSSAAPLLNREICTENGTRPRSFNISCYPVQLAQQPIGVGLLVDEITERKELEGQFLQAQKMESIGRMAGGIAHDFNNLLTVIVGYVNMALESLPSASGPAEDLQEAIRASERASRLTGQLLAFARRQPGELRLVRLDNLVLDMERMMRRVLGDDVELSVLASDEIWPVLLDPSQLEQVVLNLVVNARDAMPNGGRLTISIENLERDVATGLPMVVCTVTDTGIGMDDHVLARVFEPFFTTKDGGKGTGLGLATSYGIVRQNGGSISCTSKLGLGTTFRIALPRATGAAMTESEARPPCANYCGSETVLLVEDDASVRQVAARVLCDNGYTVVEASNGNEALAQLEARNWQQVDLLLTDLVMPQLGGLALVQRLQERNSSTKILLMSGYVGELTQHKPTSQPYPFLAKPFQPEQLAAKVREVLDG
ncbi:MAG: MASE1 domain-containing protein [Chloroflexaceae bacterium]|jgi:signal transduction histidine kinase/CheY-like chemotaxis protein|nr:MASE1 domain-containing protein [Chloroflexaceae bacterium]